MYKAAAEFDNVVLTPGPLMRQSTLGPATDGGTWTSAPEGWPGGRAVQTSLEGDARAMFGTPVEDSIATATLRIDAFNAAGTPWAGLMSRYVDSANYYYVTLRKSNELSAAQVDERRHHRARHGAAYRHARNGVPRADGDGGESPARVRKR